VRSGLLTPLFCSSKQSSKDFAGQQDALAFWAAQRAKGRAQAAAGGSTDDVDAVKHFAFSRVYVSWARPARALVRLGLTIAVLPPRS